MRIRHLLLFILVATATFSSPAAHSAVLQVKGAMDATVAFIYEQHIDFPQQAKSVTASFVVPPNFNSPTYSQAIENFDLKLTPPPQEQTRTTDSAGNTIVTATWTTPPKRIQMQERFTATVGSRLDPLSSSAPFPLKNVPADVQEYLAPTAQVQSDAPEIQAYAASLTSGVQREYLAVRNIVASVTDRLRYVNPPSQYDALYALNTGKGNCQNYSHLAAALLRAVGIPCRIVNGFTLDRPYNVKASSSTFTLKSANGRHSWVEVWFPDLGWVPFDAQKTSFFVANRFIRVETGIDNKATVSDGRLRWVRSKEGARPSFRSGVNGDFVADKAELVVVAQDESVRNILLTPELQNEVRGKAAPLPPVLAEPALPVGDSSHATASQPDSDIAPGLSRFGNLDFPQNIDFAGYGKARDMGSDTFEVTSNFLVESAEYVTTKMTQYAQIFEVKKPLALSEIGLALHRYGGSGALWVEVYADSNAAPGRVLAASDLVDTGSMSLAPGYRWADFPFKDAPVLQPGNYWLALGFSGDAIINWFYTFGKPVGPMYGTRYRDVFDKGWSKALDYEFNYRITGREM